MVFLSTEVRFYSVQPQRSDTPPCFILKFHFVEILLYSSEINQGILETQGYYEKILFKEVMRTGFFEFQVISVFELLPKLFMFRLIEMVHVSLSVHHDSQTMNICVFS